MDRRFKLEGERLFNIVQMILGLVILILSLQLGIGTLKKPGSGLFPFFCGFLILSLAILIMIFKEKTEDSGKILLDRYAKKHLALVIITFILWILLMPFLGYLLVTFIGTYSFSKIMRLEGWQKPFMLSAGTTVFCYLLFDFYLYLDLPRGFLGI
jgi:putative tricarboxylic transport membrane protein